MSISAMNWALRQRLPSPQQQILLYVIADSADPEGLTRYCTPPYMEEHARLPRSTVFRILRELEEFGLSERRKYYTERGDVRYEIQLNFQALADFPVRRRKRPDDTSSGGDDDGETQDHEDGQELNEIPESQPETLVGSDQSPTGTKPKSQSADFHIDDPSLPIESPPYPPPGGSSKLEVEMEEKRNLLWERFRQGYPSILRMDQQLAREELDALPLEDAEWAVSVLPQLSAELGKPKAPPPRNAHLFLRKRLFENFPKTAITAPPPAEVWIAEGSDEDRALRFVRSMTQALQPFVSVRDGVRGYCSPRPVGADMLAMLAYAKQRPWQWPMVLPGSHEFASWQERLQEWTGRRLSGRLGDGAIHVPAQFPPSKQGVIYEDNTDSAATGGEP